MSSLFWAVLDKEQKKKTEEILATFDKDSKDEMGLMNITIALSNKMFPGTSVLHTRLRYVFLVGWIFLESIKSKEDLSKELLIKKEKELRKILQERKKADTESFLGILGSTKINGEELSQPPYNVYFNLLKEWNIIIDKDLSVTELYRDSFCPKYLSIVENDDFKNDTFVLLKKEVEYIVEKVPPSILKTIFEKNIPLQNGEKFIDFDSSKLENVEEEELFKNAQNFSLLMWGTMLYYDYYLSNNTDELVNNFEIWKSRVKSVLVDWKPQNTLEIIEDKINKSQLIFIDNWFKYVTENVNNLDLKSPIKINGIEIEEFLLIRERELKGDRSRLLKKQNGENFNEAKFGINSIEYRWSNIIRFKKDFDNVAR